MIHLTIAELRREANALPEPCGFCHALPGEVCINRTTGKPLTKLPAHWARIRQLDITKHEKVNNE